MNEEMLSAENNGPRVLVVGGAGYVGGAVTDILIKEKIDFVVYDNLTFERDYLKPVKFVFGDILDTEKLLKVINSYKPTAIIWLAAMVGDGACKVNPDSTIKLNQNSVKWISENYDGRVVFASTCSVYGKADGVLTEDSKKNPLSLYAVTKLKAEEYLKNKDAVMFRLGTLFGIADNFSRVRFDLVVNILSLKAARQEPITVYGGEQWRPLLHVKDAAKAIAYAAIPCEDKTQEIPPGIYNIAHANMTIKQIALEIVKGYEGEPKPTITYLDIAFEDERNYNVSTERYDSLPGAQKFKISVEEGAKKMMNFVREERIKDPLHPNHHNARYVKEHVFSEK